MTEALEDKRHPLSFGRFRLFFTARFLALLASTAQTAAIGFHIYELARRTEGVRESAFLLGLFGLAQFIALFVLTIPAGVMVDRFHRKTVVLVTLLLDVVLSVCFWLYVHAETVSVAILFLLGMGQGGLRAFLGPSMTALGPMLVPKSVLPRAIAMSSVAFQAGAIIGPAVGGIMFQISSLDTYLVTALAFLLASLMIYLIHEKTNPPPSKDDRLAMVREGIAFVLQKKMLLGAMSLDLVAVLLAGATALLPVFVRDIMHGTPDQFWLLRVALPVGAIFVSIWLSFHPIRRHAGPWMYGSVAMFGLLTIIFGLSQNIYLSIGVMFMMGMADMVSVYIRGTLVQIVTPDFMRGRVASVSQVFIGASNELGEFESGVAARLVGPVWAVVLGGIGAIGATALWIKLFPELYHADRLEAEKEPAKDQT